MAENENNVVEETADQKVTKVEKPKFKSEGDDSVIKVDLNKPPTPKTDETTETEADPTGVVGGDENANAPQEQEEVYQEVETQEKIEDELFEESESLIPKMNELKDLKEIKTDWKSNLFILFIYFKFFRRC